MNMGIRESSGEYRLPSTNSKAADVHSLPARPGLSAAVMIGQWGPAGGRALQERSSANPYPGPNLQRKVATERASLGPHPTRLTAEARSPIGKRGEKASNFARHASLGLVDALVLKDSHCWQSPCFKMRQGCPAYLSGCVQ